MKHPDFKLLLNAGIVTDVVATPTERPVNRGRTTWRVSWSMWAKPVRDLGFLMQYLSGFETEPGQFDVVINSQQAGDKNSKSGNDSCQRNINAQLQQTDKQQ